MRLTELTVRSLLGGVRLTGDDVYKKVSELSGGERAKLRLAIMTLERGNVLILDEPTNHLDIDTRDVLEAALCDYTGTIIFVSHDRYLLDKLATRVIEITSDSVNNHADFSEYLDSRRTIAPITRSEQAESPPQVSGGGNYRSKEQRAAESQKRVKINRLESEIERLELLAAQLQQDMENPEIFANHELLQEKCGLYEQVKSQLADLMDEWALLE